MKNEATTNVNVNLTDLFQGLIFFFCCNLNNALVLPVGTKPTPVIKVAVKNKEKKYTLDLDSALRSH